MKKLILSLIAVALLVSSSVCVYQWITDWGKPNMDELEIKYNDIQTLTFQSAIKEITNEK